MQLPELPNGGRYTGYWRVSTEDQNPEMQIEAMVKAGVPRDRIRGDRMTGTTMKRPELDSALRITRDQDVLVVWKLDRLGRSLIGVLDIMKSLGENEIGLISLTEPYDTTNHMGRAMVQMTMVFAEMERNLIAERTKAGIGRKMEAGWTPGPKHRIRDCPVRLAFFEGLWKRGEYPGKLTDAEVVAMLNEVEGSALPKMKSVNSLSNWRKAGFKGWTPPEIGE